tara:strand:+ start:772 stop:1170 length:399 start_codon:yes stop_codon:yes gene_type:complete
VLTLKKIWAFIKSYWYVPVLVVVAIVLGSRSRRASEVIKIAKDSHLKQLKAINDAENEKAQKKAQIEKEYDEAVARVEKVYREENKALEAHKKKEIKNIVKKYYNNPEEISSRLSKSFGLTYVPTENNNNTD